MSQILVGTCSWSNPGLRGPFYPKNIAAADMITFYARNFRLVEVDSTYYHLPSVRTFQNWVERTPDDFVFDVKAFKELTKHDRDVEPSADTFGRFAQALKPMYEAGKLGVVLFQFPPWFRRSEENLDYILACKEQMQPYRLAIEFRHGSWLDLTMSRVPARGTKPLSNAKLLGQVAGVEADTLRFLRDNDLTYVAVDEPQFPGSTMPPVAVATAEIAVVRFHGRNRAAWFKRDISVDERFNYLYSDEELGEWVPKIAEMAESASQVHVLMNNCYHDFAVRNARDIVRLLGESPGGQGPYQGQPRLL